MQKDEPMHFPTHVLVVQILVLIGYDKYQGRIVLGTQNGMLILTTCQVARIEGPGAIAQEVVNFLQRCLP